MRPRFVFPLAALAALAGTSAARAQITLSHITTNQVDEFGNASGGQVWDTIESGNFDIFLIQGSDVNGTILNDLVREPSLLLSAGSNTFTLLMEPGSLNPGGGISLFFNSADSPGVSGYATFDVAAAPPSSGLGTTIYNPYSADDSGAGLIFAGPGGTTATLTSLRSFNSGVNRVGGASVGELGSQDFAVTFTVNVTNGGGAAAPEPGALALLGGAGLPAALAVRRRTRWRFA